MKNITVRKAREGELKTVQDLNQLLFEHDQPYDRTVKKMSELENTLVKEEFQGQRIGEKLFERFIEWSKGKGVNFNVGLVIGFGLASVFYLPMRKPIMEV
jgi:GNAT superfamily N-acetyltransferase